jgi:hypothetical protein
MRCSARWPFDEPRDQCSMNAWHDGPHKTYHEEGPNSGKEKHIWPNAEDKTAQK